MLYRGQVRCTIICNYKITSSSGVESRLQRAEEWGGGGSKKRCYFQEVWPTEGWTLCQAHERDDKIGVSFFFKGFIALCERNASCLCTYGWEGHLYGCLTKHSVKVNIFILLSIQVKMTIWGRYRIILHHLDTVLVVQRAWVVESDWSLFTYRFHNLLPIGWLSWT